MCFLIIFLELANRKYVRIAKKNEALKLLVVQSQDKYIRVDNKLFT